MPETIKKACPQPGCTFSTDNVCMEGRPLDCPNLESILNDDFPTEPHKEVVNPIVNSVALLPNSEYTEEQLSMISYRYPANLVLLMGDPECGKSTLYASLFDRFQKGGCGDYLFAGTQTPIGFEKRCHHARVISQNKRSNSERTNTKDFVYLHLAVREKSLKTPIRHLLFADANGERFQAARNADDDMLGLSVIKIATHVCYIADGDTLLDQGLRHSVKNDAITLIGRAVQNNMIDINKGITLIIAKWDKVCAAGAQDSLQTFFVDALKTKFPALIKDTILIASRSQNAVVSAGTGLDKFLNLVLTPQVSVENNDEEQIDEESRSFKKFKYEAR